MFYVRDADWTTDPAQAYDFATPQAAFIYARTWGMADAEPVHFLPYDASHQDSSHPSRAAA